MTDTTLIYGGTGGIGAAVARELAAEGRTVHLVAREPARLESLAREIGSAWTAGDATLPETTARVVEDLGGRPLAGLVYAIGTITLKPFARLTDDDALRDFTVNALGAARAVRSVLPLLGTGAVPSSVLLFSTVAVGQGFTNHASVAMAKGAVEGLVRSLAAELAPRVRVNAIAPSLTRTPLAAAMTGNEAMAKAIAGLHPLARLGEPDDIAPLAALLLGPRSGWITGQVLAVDGGRSTLRTKG